MNQTVAAESPLVPVSWGELIDKVTILEIKQTQISSPEALSNVRYELAALSNPVDPVLTSIPGIRRLKDKLTEINQKLWDIEDAIRQKEALKAFDEEFIELARSVYKTNDIRAAIKREINKAMNSTLTEEKSYRSPESVIQ